jgi:hypothetical protein
MKRICRDAWCGPRNTGILPVRPADFLIRCQERSPSADNINRTLERLGVIKVVRAGDQNPVGKASEFRYFLSQSKNCAENDDRRIEI